MFSQNVEGYETNYHVINALKLAAFPNSFVASLITSHVFTTFPNRFSCEFAHRSSHHPTNPPYFGSLIMEAAYVLFCAIVFMPF